MARYAILVLADALGRAVPGAGYVQSFTDTADGRGSVTFTQDPAQALTFPDQMSAFTYYRQQAVIVPRRDDGLPNRPLTAYTVEIVPLEGS